MTDHDDELTAHFEALLATLKGNLSHSEISELRIHIDYDEHQPGFEMLCEMLRRRDVPISEAMYEHLVDVGRRLGADEALWRDLLPASR